jgi:hypothetical protein
MPFGNFWAHQNPPPYAPYGQQPVDANAFYNNATPQWVYHNGQWILTHEYQGLQTRALPDQRITNSWYSNYGVNPRSGGAVTWDWVWDPRINQWTQQPVGNQPWGTSRSYTPRKTKLQKQYEQQLKEFERLERHAARDRRRYERHHQRQTRAAIGDTHIQHLHTGNTYVVDSNQATYGSGNSGFKRFVRFLGLSSGS